MFCYREGQDKNGRRTGHFRVYQKDENKKPVLLSISYEKIKAEKLTLALMIEENLDAVIYSLELQQKRSYDSSRHIILSYLHDIKNHNVPEHTLKQYQESKK